MYEKVGWKIVLIIVVVGMAFVFMFPPFDGLVPSWLANKVFGKWPSPTRKLVLGEDLQGGLNMVLSVPNANQRGPVIDVLIKRVNSSGLKEIYVRPLGTNQIEVVAPAEVPGLRDLLTSTGTLDFYSEAPEKIYQRYDQLVQQLRKNTENQSVWPPPPSGYKLEEGKDPDGRTISGLGSRSYLLMFAEPQFNAGDFIDFRLTSDKDGKPAVGFTLKAAAAPRFAAATQSLINETEYGQEHGRLAVFVNGKFESAPVVNDVISDSGIITLGGTDPTERDTKAKNLLISLQSGALNTPITLESQTETGPAIGEDSLRRGIMSLIISAAAVVIFMAVYYLFMGVVADFAMFLNLVIILGALCGFQATFTLPGFAGLVLTMGMAVDANILIYERIREERASGKAIEGAFKAGYQRAFTTILDSNLTTLIIGLILWKYGTGPIRGFGITLSVGIVTSMFTALVVTKVIFTLLIRGHLLKEARMFQLFKRPSIPFMKISPIAITCSVILIVGGLAFFMFRGGENFGIDFLGGAQYRVNLTKAITIEEARAKLQEILPPNSAPEVQSVVSPMTETAGTGKGSYEFIVRFPQRVITAMAAEGNIPQDANFGENSRQYVKDRMREVFKKEFPPDGIDISISLDESTFSQVTVTLKPKPETTRFREEVAATLAEDPFQYPVPPEIPPDQFTPTIKTSYVGKDRAKLIDELKKRCDAHGLICQDVTNFDADPGPTVVLYATFEVPPNLDAAQQAEYLGLLPGVVKKTMADNTYDDKMRTAYEVAKMEPVNLETGQPLGEGESPVVAMGEKQYAKFLLATKCTDSYKDAVGKISTILEDKVTEQKVQVGGRELPVSIAAGGIPDAKEFGGSAAQSLRATAVFSFLLAMVGIIIYVWFRFRQFRYGFAAVAALVHDVSITVGLLALIDHFTPLNIKFELTIVAALLTLVGYSVNDTIVVFDRIRENLGLHREERYFVENVDNSINQTLSRTILTSLTVFLTVLILAIFGGEMVRGFAITMCIGVIVGTYSSVFIASPIVVWFHRREVRQLAVTPVTRGA